MRHFWSCDGDDLDTFFNLVFVVENGMGIEGTATQERCWEIAQEKQKMPLVAVKLAANHISWISVVKCKK